MRPHIRYSLLIGLSAFLAACSGPAADPAPPSSIAAEEADEPASSSFYLIDLVTVPAPLTPAAGPERRYVLPRKLRVRSQGGRTRAIVADTTWAEHGTIAQGTVYRPVDSVFRVYAFKAVEAYLVVSDGKVVGFWLPAEQAFNPAQGRARIALKPVEGRSAGATEQHDHQ
jgi:hypothetical protein